MTAGEWAIRIVAGAVAGGAAGAGGAYVRILWRRHRDRNRASMPLASFTVTRTVVDPNLVLRHDPRTPGRPVPVPEVGMRVYVADTGQTLEYTGEPEPWREMAGD